MYVDKENVFSESWDLSQTAGTSYAGGCIDLGVAARDVGAGRPMYAVIVVDEAFSSAAAATIQFRLLEESDTTIDSDSTELISSEVFAYTALTLGCKPVVLPVPPGVALRYLGMEAIIGDQTTTVGTVTAFLTTEVQTNY